MKRLFLSSLVGVAIFMSSAINAQAAEYPTIRAISVLAYTNAQRYMNGLSFLDSNVALSTAAATKLKDLFARQYFAHESPTGESISDLVEDVGYDFLTVGENLALGDFASSKAVVEAWMDSPGHRANILSSKYSEIGIATGRGMYEGRNTWIVVQAFGLPKSACAGLDQRLSNEIDTLENRLKILEIIAELRESRMQEDGISRTEYIRRVNSYNAAAELYNTTADRYRDLVYEYNEGVSDFNECVTDRVGVASH